MYNFPFKKNAYYHMNICTASQLKKNNWKFQLGYYEEGVCYFDKSKMNILW